MSRKKKYSTLLRVGLVKYDENRRDVNDLRKFVSWAVYEYTDERTGAEHRKAFVAPPFTPEKDFDNIAPLVIVI